MTTQLISLNEYRKNLSSLWKKSREQNIRYLVLVHGKPVFEVNPIIDNNFDEDWIEVTEEDKKAYIKAKEELKRGEAIDFSDFLEKNLLHELKEEYEKNLQNYNMKESG